MAKVVNSSTIGSQASMSPNQNIKDNGNANQAAMDGFLQQGLNRQPTIPAGGNKQFTQEDDVVSFAKPGIMVSFEETPSLGPGNGFIEKDLSAENLESPNLKQKEMNTYQYQQMKETQGRSDSRVSAPAQQEEAVQQLQLTSMPTQVLYERLRKEIRQRHENLHYDSDTKEFYLTAGGNEYYGPKQGTGEKSRCHVCNRHSKKMEYKEEFRALKAVQKDEKAFQEFLKKDLNEEGKVKKAVQAEQVADQSEVIDPDKIDYLRDLKKGKKDIIKPKEQFVFLTKPFNWLMEKLVSPSERISGCEVNIPDMVIFEHGKPKMFLKNERDGCIAQIMKSKNSITDVRNYFMQLSEERKRMREQEALQQQVANNATQQFETSQGNQQGKFERANTANTFTDANAQLRLQSEQQVNGHDAGQNKGQGQAKNSKAIAGARNGSIERSPDLRNRGPNKSRTSKDPSDSKAQRGNLKDQFYQDHFMLRHLPEAKISSLHSLKILNEQDFQQEFKLKHSDSHWQTVGSIQMTPQYKIGLGRYFRFTFAPICYEQHEEKKPRQKASEDESDEEDQYDPEIALPKTRQPTSKHHQNVADKLLGAVEFNFSQYGHDDIALQLKHPQAYCLKVCNKIGYYLQVLHQIDIIRMQVEFFQDETGLIQLYHAKKIWIRCLESNKILKKKGEGANRAAKSKAFSGNQSINLKIPSQTAAVVNSQKSMQNMGTAPLLPTYNLLTQVVDELTAFQKSPKGNILAMIDRFNQQLDHIVNASSNVYRGSTMPATKTSSVDRSQPEKTEKKEADDKDIKGATGKGFFQDKEQQMSQFVLTRQNKELIHDTRIKEKRNMLQLSKSAFDRIGNLGELQSRAQAADGDVDKYQELLQARYDKTRMLFDRARLRRESSVQSKNMLEWLRSQKGKQNFLVPVVAAPSRNKSLENLGNP